MARKEIGRKGKGGAGMRAGNGIELVVRGKFPPLLPDFTEKVIGMGAEGSSDDG